PRAHRRRRVARTLDPRQASNRRPVHHRPRALSMTRVGIDALTYYLPASAPTLAELERRGALRGPASTLAGFGFERARVAESETHVDMAMRAVRALLDETNTAPDEIDLVLHAGALTSSSTMECAPAPAGSVLVMRDLMDFFKYPVSQLQSELDLVN